MLFTLKLTSSVTLGPTSVLYVPPFRLEDSYASFERWIKSYLLLLRCGKMGIGKKFVEANQAVFTATFMYIVIQRDLQK